MAWDVFNIIGTIAFAVSGASIAIERKYDIWGIYAFGLVTAFGGGIVRNMLLILPTSLWSESGLIKISLISITAVFIFPSVWFKFKKYWMVFDAIGLGAFAVQGALYVQSKGFPLSAVLIASVLTGIGGGVIRDILATKKPLVFYDEIYAVWALLAGCVIGFGWATKPLELYALFGCIVTLRVISVIYGWKLPHVSINRRKNFTEHS
ncbi:trimeric intracellular cation channel family protein [Fodinisporobacter ferrooxydans]|uniref:Trimeric intracellular cation channel family protein n=1 Tax=Fodinisporobacter ferrooxydans TaxID=2901836 RepID=A0ABY4CFK8_9BACL|nr:trimeric intracellular cation channel family protein [Alicyclobacillaceae bacterium MYW30-H2]